MEDNLYSNFIELLCDAYLKKNHNVFDCGCGDGLHTSIIQNNTRNITGGDFDNRINKKYHINFRKIKVNKYGKKNEFDIVTSFDVIEHVEDDYSYLKEIIKITKPGGRIIIGTPNRDRLSNKILSLYKGEIKYPRNLGYHYESGGDIIHIREYTKDDLINLSKRFEDIKNIQVLSAFLGLYSPIGPVGFKGLDIKIFSKYAQHLFLILEKNK